MYCIYFLINFNYFILHYVMYIVHIAYVRIQPIEAQSPIFDVYQLPRYYPKLCRPTNRISLQRNAPSC